MKKRIITGNKVQDELLEGAKILYEAVSVTLGPKGKNGVIQAFGEPIVTHDGVTVAKAIENVQDASPGAQVGIEMIKSSSSKTNDKAGDGTTSSTILAYQTMEDGIVKIRTGKNAMVLRRELDLAKDEVLATLETLSIPVKTEKQAIEIATISSENHDIGMNVGKMFHKLGSNGMVAVEIGQKPEIEYEIIEGYTFDRGFITPMMMTDIRTQSATLVHPPILLAHQTVALRDVIVLVEDLFAKGADSLIIVADDFKSDLLEYAFQRNDEISIIGVKAPGFGEQRIELLKDLGKFVGTEPVGNGLPKKIDTVTAKDVGTCDKIIVTSNETVITGGQDVSEYIKDLEGKLKLTKGEFEQSKIEKRISQLHAKIGQIRVGGSTEMEAEERKYLVDDAVAATEAALKEGIVPGGGTTYIELAKRLTQTTDGAEVLRGALYAPFKVLMTNAGLRYGIKQEELTEFGKGFDIMGDGDLVDLKEHGVIDPVLVIKQAITNAVSVAGSVLTAGVLITNEKEKDDFKEQD